MQPPRPLKGWEPVQRALAEQIMRRVLKGAGDEMEMHTQDGDVAIHYRRRCTSAEAAEIERRTPSAPIFWERGRR